MFHLSLSMSRSILKRTSFYINVSNHHPSNSITKRAILNHNHNIINIHNKSNHHENSSRTFTTTAATKENYDQDDSQESYIRLSKRMSELNLCSRREADKLITQSRVYVNGITVNTLGTKVSSNETNIKIAYDNDYDDSVHSDIESHFHWDKIRGDTVMLHKPKNYVSGQPDPKHGHIPAVRLLTRNNIYFPNNSDDDFDELNYTLTSGKYLHFSRKKVLQRRRRDENGNYDDEKELITSSTLTNYAPAGRLDLNSTGVLIFTKNGVIAKKILGQYTEKEYIVEVEPVVNITRHEREMGIKFLPYPPRWDLSELLKGGKRLWNDRKPLKPLLEAKWIEEGKNTKGEWNGTGRIKLVLQEGKKRQIRRMCRELLGLNVKELKRTRVGNINLGSLPEGRWRTLTEKEVKDLLE